METRKSIKIELQGLQNPSKKQLETNSGSEGVSEPRFFRYFRIFDGFLDLKTEPKSRKNRIKIDVEEQRISGHGF